MKQIITLLLALSALVTSEATAQNKHFDATVNEILANNLTLAARRAANDADCQALRAENNLADPEVELEHLWGRPAIGNKFTLSVVQSFDWPGVYRSRSAAAKAGSKASDLLFLADIADTRLRVCTTLTDYIAALLQLRLSETISNNLAVIAENVKTAYDNGEATILDFRKIQFEKIEAETATDAAASLLASLRQELVSLNGGQPLDLDSIVDFPHYQLNTAAYYLDRHMTSDPALMAAKYASQAAVENLRTAKLSNLPGFSVGYTYNAENGDRFHGFKFGVSLPFFSNRHRKAEAAARLMEADVQELETVVTVNSRVSSEYSRAALLDRRAAVYATLFPADGDDYLTLLRKAYEGGQMTLINYLYEINYYTQARSNYITLLHDRTLSIQSLNRF